MIKLRSTWLLLFIVFLHALAILSIWRSGEGRIAEQVVIVSVIPVLLGGAYLLRRIGEAMTWLDIWVLVYAAWSTASFILYLQPDNPSLVGAYAFGLYHFVLPIACYFAVKSTPKSEHPRLVTGLVALNALVMVYGLYLHFVRPEFYLNYLMNRLAQVDVQMEEWQYFARMQSYLGSTSVGYLGAASLVLLTLTTARVKRFLPVLVPLFAAGAALSFQRASFVAVGVALGYLTFLYRGGVWLRVLMVATIAATVVYGTTRLDDAYREILQRRATTEIATGTTSFFEERGYARGFKYLRVFPLGVGVGGTSSAAAQAGFVPNEEVSDANFMRIAADLGVQGLLLLLLVLAAAAARAVSSHHPAAWLTLLVVHCGIMLSTNVFDSFYISHSFWLLLAVLDCDRGKVPMAAAEISPVASAKPAFG